MLLNQMPRVSIYLPSSLDNFRQTLLGIAKYEQLNGPWLIRVTKSDYWRLENLKFSPKGDAGRILRIDSETPSWYLKNDVPTVVLNPSDEQLQNRRVAAMTRFVYDFHGVGRMAAEFFLRKKFTHFAYVRAIRETLWTTRQREGYLQCLEENGMECHEYVPLDLNRYPLARELARMGKWLRKLPSPAALFAANEFIAPVVLQACICEEISVPQDISVLSMGGDEVTCRLCQPALSSIRFLPEERGFQMAAVLDRLMRGTEKPGKIYTYAPQMVMERESTDRILISDPMVLKAREYIRVNLASSFGIPEVVRHVGVPRSTLQRHFLHAVGCTIPEEITRLRLEKLSRLLVQTERSTSELAQLCGFRSVNYACRVFFNRFGQTMTEYRKQH